MSGPVRINQAFTRLVSDASLVTEPRRDGSASSPAAVGCSDIWSAPLSDLSWLISTGSPWNINKISLERLSEGCRSVSERGDYGWNCSADSRLLPLSTVAASFSQILYRPFVIIKHALFALFHQGKENHNTLPLCQPQLSKRIPLILSRSALKIKEGLFCMPLAEGDEILYFYGRAAVNDTSLPQLLDSPSLLTSNSSHFPRMPAGQEWQCQLFFSHERN